MYLVWIRFWVVYQISDLTSQIYPCKDFFLFADELSAP